MSPLRSTPEDDWRLTGQETYLTGVDLCWRPYRAYREGWDHDHCEFCMAKFAESERIAEALHAGYATVDEYRWICDACFDDFHERFGWNVVVCDTNAARS